VGGLYKFANPVETHSLLKRLVSTLGAYEVKEIRVSEYFAFRVRLVLPTPRPFSTLSLLSDAPMLFGTAMVGRCTLTPPDPWLKGAWFQPLHV
jgi:hypothetical protein